MISRPYMLKGRGRWFSDDSTQELTLEKVSVIEGCSKIIRLGVISFMDDSLPALRTGDIQVVQRQSRW